MHVCSSFGRLNEARLCSVSQPLSAAQFPALWEFVWPMVLKALKDEQLQHNDWPELHALAAIIAIYVGEAVTRRPWRRMSAVTVYN